jgi:hypothetical protein
MSINVGNAQDRKFINVGNAQDRKFKILVAIVDSDLEKLVEQYETDVEDLDPYELKRLLQNVCERILSNYRRDLLLGYPLKRNNEPDSLKEVLAL